VQLLSYRRCYGVAVLLCAFLLAAAFYLQFSQGFAPCPLCELQRGMLILLVVIFLIAALHNPQALWVKKSYAVAILLFALLGIGLSVRHLWLQCYAPPGATNCGADLEYLLSVLPLQEVLKMALRGTGDCAKVVWRFLGLSIPAWTLLGFVGLGVLSILPFLGNKKKS